MKRYIRWFIEPPKNQPLRKAPWRETWQPNKHSILNAYVLGVATFGTDSKHVLYLLVDDPLLAMPPDPYLGDIVRIVKEPAGNGDPHELQEVSNLVDPIEAEQFRKLLARERKSIERIKKQHEAGKYSPAIAPPMRTELRYPFAVIRDGWRWVYKKVVTK
jgi:hypothetical protein